jgi:hypothetical protein
VSLRKGVFRPWIHRRYFAAALICALLPLCALTAWWIGYDDQEGIDSTAELRDAATAQLGIPVLAQSKAVEVRLNAVGTYVVILQTYAQTVLKSPEIYGAMHSQEGAIGTPGGAAKPLVAAGETRAVLDNPILYSKGADGALRKLLDNKGTAVFFRARDEGSFTVYDKQRLYATAALDPLLIKGSSDPLVTQAFVLTNDGLLRTAPFFDTSTIDGRRDFRQQPLAAWSKDKADSRGLVWTAPYISFMTPGWVCACTAPVMLGSKQIGVVGVEVSLAALQPELLTFSLGSDSYSWLQREDGVVLAASVGAEQDLSVEALGIAVLPGEGAQAKTILEDSNVLLKGDAQLQDALGSVTPSAPVPLGNVERGRFVAVSPLGSSGWVLGAVISSPLIAALSSTQEDSSGRLVRLMLGTVIAAAFGLLLAGLLSWMEAKRIVNPIRVLTQRVRQVITGRGTAVSIADEGEIGTLAEAIQSLIDRRPPDEVPVERRQS